jgi:type I restriction enzyme S subunit
MSELPAGWEKLRLGDIAARTSNVDPSGFPQEMFELYSVPSFSLGAPDRVPGIEIKSFKQAVEPEDVLLCKIVPHINRVWTIPAKERPRQIASGEWIVYRGHYSDPDYLRYCLSEGSFRKQFMTTVAGVGGSLMRARPSEVAKLEIPLAPFDEQRRIVAKIDSLSGKSRRARDHLDHTPRLIEKYKQAILASAFRGELTRQWRQTHACQCPVLSEHKIDERAAALSELPDTWRWVAMNDIATITGGLTKNPKRELLPHKVPYLRVANVYANELRLHEIAEIGCTDAELEKTRLQKGDLLIVEGNGSLDQIGRVAVWNDDIAGCSHQNHIIRARPRRDVAAKYVLYWLLSSDGRNFIEAVASSSSGLHTLSISKVGGLPIPICAIDEQHEAVRLIDTAFTWINRLASDATSARKLIDHLIQAVLARAFRGELVPQDPSDEPASVLLDRIQAGRAERSVKASTRTRSPTTQR